MNPAEIMKVLNGVSAAWGDLDKPEIQRGLSQAQFEALLNVRLLIAHLQFGQQARHDDPRPPLILRKQQQQH